MNQSSPRPLRSQKNILWTAVLLSSAIFVVLTLPFVLFKFKWNDRLPPPVEEHFQSIAGTENKEIAVRYVGGAIVLSVCSGFLAVEILRRWKARGNVDPILKYLQDHHIDVSDLEAATDSDLDPAPVAMELPSLDEDSWPEAEAASAPTEIGLGAYTDIPSAEEIDLLAVEQLASDSPLAAATYLNHHSDPEGHYDEPSFSSLVTLAELDWMKHQHSADPSDGWEDGVSDAPQDTAATGLTGAGLNGAGSNSAGSNGAGLNGAGSNGGGSNGAGLNGAGLNGAGLNRAGLNGASHYQATGAIDPLRRETAEETAALNPESEVLILSDRDAYQTCRIKLTTFERRLFAILFDGQYYSLLRTCPSQEKALELASKLKHQGHNVVLTNTDRRHIVWVLQPDACLESVS